jgi:hypothetical protein
MPKAENKRERLLVAVKSIEALGAFLRFDRQGRYRPRSRAAHDAAVGPDGRPGREHVDEQVEQQSADV